MPLLLRRHGKSLLHLCAQRRQLLLETADLTAQAGKLVFTGKPEPADYAVHLLAHERAHLVGREQGCDLLTRVGCRLHTLVHHVADGVTTLRPQPLGQLGGLRSRHAQDPGGQLEIRADAGHGIVLGGLLAHGSTLRGPGPVSRCARSINAAAPATRGG